MINITENTFFENPGKAFDRLKKEHEILKVVSDENSYVIIDESEWNDIYETLYLNSLKGFPQTIIEASTEDLENAVKLKDLNW